MTITRWAAYALSFLVIFVSACSSVKHQTNEKVVIAQTEEEKNSVLDHKLEKFKKLASEFPEDAVYEERLSQLYWMRDDYARALSHIRRARKIEANNPKYDFIEGRIYRSIGNLKKAEAAFKNMVTNTSKEENFTGPYFELAYLYILQKNLKLAETYLEKCMALDENFSDPYYFMGEISKNRGQDQKAIEYYETYLKKNGERYQKPVLNSLYELQPNIDRRYTIK